MLFLKEAASKPSQANLFISKLVNHASLLLLRIITMVKDTVQLLPYLCQ
jgi:hypothetical protein